MGWGRGHLCGPLHPPLSAPPFPGALEGRDGPLVPAHRRPARTQKRRRGAGLHGFGSVVWVLVDRTAEPKQSSPEDSPHPRGLRRLGWLLPWSSWGRQV